MHKLELTLPEIQIIGEALGNMPYAKVSALFAKIQGQLNKPNAPEQPSQAG